MVTKADVKFTLTVSALREVLSDAKKILLLTRIQRKYSVQAESFLSWFLPRKQASLHIKYLARCAFRVDTFIERVPGFELTCAAGFRPWERWLVKPTQSLKKAHLWRAVTFFVCHFRVSSLPIQRRQWQPTPVLLPGKSHGWRSLANYSPRGCKESDMTEWLTISVFLFFFFPWIFWWAELKWTGPSHFYSRHRVWLEQYWK